MSEKQRLDKLFSSARETKLYGSINRHLPQNETSKRTCNFSSVENNVRNSEEESASSKEKLNYSYGL